VLCACQRYGMGMMAWSPLAKGMLTGRYRKPSHGPIRCAMTIFSIGSTKSCRRVSMWLRWKELRIRHRQSRRPRCVAEQAWSGGRLDIASLQ